MCGISGLLNFTDRNIDADKIIREIIKIQDFRGPDDNGKWKSSCGKVLFGHNRLSIIDLTLRGKQPFISIDNNFTITFNGEIYNYKEIKNELISKKIKFKSDTDTEVIIEAYKFWGLEFLQKLRGMYAFGIWDNKNKKLILARDAFGIKPLYYSFKNGVCYFASQVKSFRAVNDISSSKSEAGIVSFFMWGHIQEPYTIYRDIKSLDKGSCLIIEINGNTKNIKFADIKREIIEANDLKFNNHNEKIEFLKESVEETVKYHQISDVPITFLLSSGIDSSTIVSSIKNKENCNALTLDLDADNFEYDEKFLAKKTANLNSIPHVIEKISLNEVKFLIDQFFKNMDQPSNDGLNSFLISHIAKKELNSKVVISGVGGDEFFFGYPSFERINKINNIMKFIPNLKIVDDFFKKFLYSFLKRKKLNTKISGIYSYGRNLENTFLLQRSAFLEHEFEEMISPETFKRGLEEIDMGTQLKQDIKEIKNTKLSIMYLEIKYYLCSKLLKDLDWTSMYNSIEMRTPLVDFFFFKKILPLLKFNNDIGKKSLLDIVKPKVPKELYNRKKTGFGIPHRKYLNIYSGKKINYQNSLKDWSILSYKKYIENNF
tara:strand:+ start:2399 stop:4201 length:1803 start_codon:yes stop_codon:yes gene_type:complete